MVRQQLLAPEMADKFDIVILADGGGSAGQAGAARLGIARALIEFNSELRPKLKQLGLLTRDPRQHERKKYGQKGARKRFQFSKRYSGPPGHASRTADLPTTHTNSALGVSHAR